MRRCIHSHPKAYDIPLAKHCDVGNLNIRCRVYKSQPLVPILNQIKINPIRSNPVHFFKVYFNDVLRSTMRPSICSRFFTLPYQNPLCISFPTHACHMHRVSLLPSFNNNNFIWRLFQIKSFFII